MSELPDLHRRLLAEIAREPEHEPEPLPAGSFDGGVHSAPASIDFPTETDPAKVIAAVEAMSTLPARLKRGQ